jgi:hypothetical protein
MSKENNKPYISWVWNDDLNDWIAPVDQPDKKWLYVWDEESVIWKNTGFRVDPFKKEQVFS